jgi:O-acetyl-ADP-ribose deacetylase (regulator of RNase III)
VIHTVGPIWEGGTANERETLRAAYESSFRLAIDQGDIRTIAFPAISTGVYGFPSAAAADIAVAVMGEFDHCFEEITACLFNDAAVTAYREVLARGL